tara:strand:+ start:1295 stop:1543 length:249 start_codon:yes stop_codon:yes gene_type:complete
MNYKTLKVADAKLQKNDWLNYLKPIIADFKDGEDKMSEEDINWLANIIKAKIRFNEGLITELDYLIILNDLHDYIEEDMFGN